MFYILNFIFFYSVLGFLLESFYYKLHDVPFHSGIFIGPYNFIYGIAMLICYLLTNLFSLPNTSLSIILYYFIFVIITTVIEFIAGHLIHFLLKKDQWDYSPYLMHFGKYICLKNSLIWGLLVLFCLFIFQPYLNLYLFNTLPNSFPIFLLIVFLIDFAISLKKIIKKNRFISISI